MLDDFRDGQPIAVSIFEKAIKDDKLSHAYLIDVNNYSRAFDLVLSFVKSIICSDLSDNDEISNICKRIDDGNYTELKIIESDGNWIKKEQMTNLQDEFSLKGIEGKKRIYIIKDCEKMNIQTSNSILKFLEEPEDNIIAILMCNNISQLLDTIISRCQFIRLFSDKRKNDSTINNLCDMYCSSIVDREKFLNDDKYNNIINNFISFVKLFESKGTSIIVDIKKYSNELFDDREIVDIVLDLWINMYYDVLLAMNNREICFFVDYEDYVNEIVSLNTVSCILNKLEVLIDAKSSFKYNLNINLFIDKLIIDLVGEK